MTESQSQHDPAASSRQPDTPAPRGNKVTPTFPVWTLLGAIVVVSFVLIGVWTLIRFGADLSSETYIAGVLGLFSASMANVIGTLAGAALAPAKGSAQAYLASSVIRFVLTPLLAVSVYFLLPVKPQPLLLAAVAGYLLILVVDVGAMFREMQRKA